MADLIFPVAIESPWPTNLPGPTLGSPLSLTPGTSVIRRRGQSGRIELRRKGNVSPDKWSGLTFRFNETELQEFEDYFDANLHLGTKWFYASWITSLMYLSSSFYAKINGYPKKRYKMFPYRGYIDVVVDLLVSRINIFI